MPFQRGNQFWQSLEECARKRCSERGTVNHNHIISQHDTVSRLPLGRDAAQMVKRRAEKPGTILTRVQVPNAAKVYFPESTFKLELLQTLLRCS